MSAASERPVGPVRLAGERVVLEPLSPEHHDGLVEAVQDGEPWRLWYTRVPAPDGMAAEIERRLGLQEEGRMVPFTIRAASGDVLGMTTYMNIDQVTPRVEVGSTWLRASAQGTGVNAEAKLLLLTHAFDSLGVPAVEFRTHWLNRQSRSAIERLGAQLDGVLRSHEYVGGALRNTCVYSILAHEWPAVRSQLEARLGR